MEKLERVAADPELRDVASSALVTLTRVTEEASKVEEESSAQKANSDEIQQALKDTIRITQDVKVDQTTLEYITSLCCLLMDIKCYDFEEWRDCMVPYLTSFLIEEQSETCCRAFMSR